MILTLSMPKQTTMPCVLFEFSPITKFVDPLLVDLEVMDSNQSWVGILYLLFALFHVPGTLFPELAEINKLHCRFYGKFWQLAANTCTVDFTDANRLFTVILTHERAV